MSAARPSAARGRPHLDLSRVPSLGDALRDATVPFGSNVALIECDREREVRRLTFSEMRREGEGLGACLQELGVGAGDRVSLVMSNQSAWITTALGALWAGAVLVPVDYKLEPPEIAGILEHARPKALVIEHAIWRRLRAAGAVLPAATVVVGAPEPEGPEDLEGAVRFPTGSAAPRLQPMSRGRGDPAAIVYSSGTGGTPKGCILTHGAYLAQAEVLGNLFPMAEDDRFFSILPTNHAIDFMCGFVIPLCFGASVVHQRTLRPQYLQATLQRYHVTHMALVPAILAALRQRVEEALEGLDPWRRALLEQLVHANAALTERRPRPALSARLLGPVHAAFGGRLRLLVCGGAMVDRRDAELFYRLGIPVAIGYGLTEACTVVSVNDLAPFRGDTVGRPVPGTEVELRERGEDGVGEVWVRSPTVMAGYFEQPELTSEVLVDGWLRTGDLGRLDAAGHLQLVGRRANMIVTPGGKNVYPEDIEAALGEVPGCAESCVMAVNYVWTARALVGEELVAVLRPKVPPEDEPRRDEAGTSAATHAAVVAQLSERNRRLPAHKRVHRVLLWPTAFPRTASLKLRRAALAEAIRGSVGPQAAASITAD